MTDCVTQECGMWVINFKATIFKQYAAARGPEGGLELRRKFCVIRTVHIVIHTVHIVIDTVHIL